MFSIITRRMSKKSVFYKGNARFSSWNFPDPKDSENTKSGNQGRRRWYLWLYSGSALLLTFGVVNSFGNIGDKVIRFTKRVPEHMRENLIQQKYFSKKMDLSSLPLSEIEIIQRCSEIWINGIHKIMFPNLTIFSILAPLSVVLHIWHYRAYRLAMPLGSKLLLVFWGICGNLLGISQFIHFKHSLVHYEQIHEKCEHLLQGVKKEE
ncbi:unnamed protein product [Moneuplotes crassus]|uniref:Uncharacterized protein n=1 Tax=Euplotes crassus TaxID=5936 RepID=A0AAD1XX71_EUPCR|nr:unnamed protein product [Moneuplotes crassus]